MILEERSKETVTVEERTGFNAQTGAGEEIERGTAETFLEAA